MAHAPPTPPPPTHTTTPTTTTAAAPWQEGTPTTANAASANQPTNQPPTMSNVPDPGPGGGGLPGIVGSRARPPRPATPTRHRSIDGTVVSEADAARLATAVRARELAVERALVEAAAAAVPALCPPEPALDRAVPDADAEAADGNVAVKAGSGRAPVVTAGFAAALFCCLLVSITLGVVLRGSGSGSGDRCVWVRAQSVRAQSERAQWHAHDRVGHFIGALGHMTVWATSSAPWGLAGTDAHQQQHAESVQERQL